jgi:cytochrome P450
VAFLGQVFRWFNRSKIDAMAGLPGPAPSFPAGNATDLLGDRPWEVCADYGRKYGPVTLIWIFGSPTLVLNGAEQIGEVLQTRRDEFYKASPTDALRPVITDNCPFICNGEDWQFKRENHPFSTPDLSAWLDTQVAPMRAQLAAGIQAMVARSRSGPLDLLEEVQRLSFDAFSVAVWGKPLGNDAYTWFVTLGDEGDFRIKSPVSLPVLSPRFYLHKRRWYALYARLIQEAKGQADPSRGDLMSVLLRRGTKLTPDGFKDSLANIFFGGIFSVTSAVTTTLYLLALNPQEATKLQGALDGLGLADARFDRATLEACHPLDHVLREALRYYCPVPMYSRNTLKTKTVSFAGKDLPPNTSMFITNWLLHRSPEHWVDADRFLPDRWANDGVARDPLGSGYFFPFGRGPRMCVGLPFAMFYMKLALAALLTRSRVSLDPTQPYVQKMHFGVMSPQDLQARLEAR